MDPPQAPLILTRQDMEAPEMLEIGPGVVAYFTGRSPARPTDNEDAAAVLPAGGGRALLAVADGVGGQRSGAEAAGAALAALADALAKPPADGGLRTAVLDGFEQANARVTALGSGAATTLAALEIEAAAVRPYHVGDSEIFVVGQRGKLKLQTVSHSPVAYAVEAGLLDALEAIHHEDRHLVSNIVGADDMRIEIGRTLQLRARDTVVLGTDGLFDNLHFSEIVDLVRKGPLLAAAGALADACRRRMREPEPQHPSKPDDLTFLLYRPGT